MKYFANRHEAGDQLADILDPKYGNQNTVVLALSEGGLQVGIAIAKRLHSSVNLLLIEPVEIPGETEPIGMMDQDGRFTYNNMYTAGNIEYYETEYRNQIERSKLEKRSLIHRLLGKGGFVDPQRLQNHVVIIVNDAVPTATSFDPVTSFLKPIKVKKTIAALPVASVAAVDKLHAMVDEIHCLNVATDFVDIDHYYDNNDRLNQEQIIEVIDNMSLYWT